MNSEYLLVLGSNLGKPKENLTVAISLLDLEEIKVLNKTSILSTKAEHVHNQADFLNQGLLVSAKHPPLKLLEKIKNIEKKMGRKQAKRYSARLIDIDIVWWSGGAWNSLGLKIPHVYNEARYWVRQFVSELISEQTNQFGIQYGTMNYKGIKTAQDFIKKKNAGEKITILTCYDYSMAKILSTTSLDGVMIGDSLANTMQGKSSTIPVTVDEIIYHCNNVRRGLPDKFIVADLPFMSYLTSKKDALRAAARLMKESTPDAVKFEGCHPKLIGKMVSAGIPVMGHLGFTPQSIKSTGIKVYGKSSVSEERLLEDSLKMQEAGCFAIVFEMVKADVAAKIQAKLEIPIIGIGAGGQTAGQVLVIQDMLGMNNDFEPKFVKKYTDLTFEIKKAVEGYCDEVRQDKFPGDEHSY